MTPRTKVLIVLAVLLAGWVVLVVADVAWGSPVPRPDAVDLGSPDDYGWMAVGFVVLVVVLYKAIVGLWRASRVVGRAAAWVQSRPTTDADAFDEAADEAVALVSPGYVTRVETQLCNELWALPTYDPRITP